MSACFSLDEEKGNSLNALFVVGNRLAVVRGEPSGGDRVGHHTEPPAEGGGRVGCGVHGFVCACVCAHVPVRVCVRACGACVRESRLTHLPLDCESRTMIRAPFSRFNSMSMRLR